ncbi:MAG: ArsC family transcriptional regulator [Oscillospiraceae bacterium]|nr:ArsC family transcriptional regulator [Oscillospiraceae bacterium]
MNIQIFGRKKCFDTQKAQRYFKERRIKFQYIDVDRYGMSRGELQSVKNAVGLENLINTKDEDYPLIQYLASNEAKMDKLFEDPYLIKTPVVRNGKQATVGYCPDVWKNWE